MWELKLGQTHVRAVHRGTVQSRKLDCERVIKTGSKRNVTWLRRHEVEHPHEDEEHGEVGSVGGSKHKCSRICGRSEQKLNVQWRSWEQAVLINCATVRRREKWSRHHGVFERKVTHGADNLWRDSFEKEQIPVYKRVHQDQMRRRLADLSGTIMHAPDNRRTVGGNSRGSKRSKGNGSAFAKNNGRTAMVGSDHSG